jgi:hypothetical protein
MADMSWWQIYPLLTLLGGVIGTYGTLIGTGRWRGGSLLRAGNSTLPPSG